MPCAMDLLTRLQFRHNIPNPEGYDIPFTQAVREELYCPICMLVVRDAVVTEECGHLFCDRCLTQNMKRTKECPVCRMKIEGDNIARRDVRTRREISNLTVLCINNDKGCEWKGVLADLDKHCDSVCPYHLLPCTNPFCGILVQRQRMCRHQCRGELATPSEKKKMVDATVLMQALFRGFWTRRRYKWLRLMEDKEMSFQNQMFRGLALMQAQDVRRSIDLQANAHHGNTGIQSAANPDADDPSPERRASIPATQEPQEEMEPFRDPANYARPCPPPYLASGQPPRVEGEDQDGGEIEDMDVDDLGEEAAAVTDEEGSVRGRRYSRSSSFAWNLEEQDEDIVEVLTNCGCDELESTRMSGMYATLATSVAAEYGDADQWSNTMNAFADADIEDNSGTMIEPLEIDQALLDAANPNEFLDTRMLETIAEALDEDFVEADTLVDTMDGEQTDCFQKNKKLELILEEDVTEVQDEDLPESSRSGKNKYVAQSVTDEDLSLVLKNVRSHPVRKRRLTHC
mmetsp:Transcript_54639/g.97134  ORF Transcript_54639/g.97134 Transcript_54639/m.97134 type:complete len:515 (-) Transcript_54639:256-1800(-)